MIYLILYDISEDKLRTKIAKRLIAEGFIRLQLSVFTGIQNPKDITLLWNQLNQWLQLEPSAKFYILPLTENNFRNMEILGSTDLDLDFLTGNQHTLFI